jgi:hypothetical protein
MKVILDCPYEQRHQAKALGARWDPKIKKWYVIDPPDLTPFVPWLPDNVAEFVKQPTAGVSMAAPKAARSTAPKKSQPTHRQNSPLALPALAPWPSSDVAADDDGPPWD